MEVAGFGYEHLYRHEIDDGPALAGHVEAFLDVYNRRRQHEALNFALPVDYHTADPADNENPTDTPPPTGQLVSISRHGAREAGSHHPTVGRTPDGTNRR